MKKKLVLEPAGITTETRGRWTYTTLRPLKAWMLTPRTLPKSQAIYYPMSGKSEQLRKKEDVHFRPLLCYSKPTAPVS
jgi:hypothetical protein